MTDDASPDSPTATDAPTATDSVALDALEPASDGTGTPSEPSTDGNGASSNGGGDVWPAPEPSKRRTNAFTWIVAAFAAIVIIAVAVGYFVRVPYYSISPGEALEVNPLVKVEGARTYKPDGSVMLLYVQERSRLRLMEYIRASLDKDIDLVREKDLVGNSTPEEVEVQSVYQMAASQLAAKKVALEAAGFKVPLTRQGVEVVTVIPSMPANNVLKPHDIVVAANGQRLTGPDALGSIVRSLQPGDDVTLRIDRAGKLRTVQVGTEKNDNGNTAIGVFVTQPYNFPVDVSIDTSTIGGPSAGLAMALSVLDELTPGDLTGGQRVAVTGTIADDGHVGEIGGINQKAVAARAAHASLFIVPECEPPPLDLSGRDASDAVAHYQSCQHDLARAKKRAGDIPVVEVGTFREALDVLQEHGGDPVTRVGS